MQGHKNIAIPHYIYPMLRTILTLILCCFLIKSIHAQTQIDINQTAANNYQAADKALNTTYQQILKDYKDDTAFTHSLKTAQRIWIQFRDAEMLARYPNREPGYYGTMLPACWSNCMTTLTTRRTADLKLWLTGIPEGDACAGSVKTK